MSTEQIDSEELAALRSQAASAIPWSNEAHRLAEALHRVNHENPALRGEPWQSYFEKKEAERHKRGKSPAMGPNAADAEAQVLNTIADELLPDKKV